MAPLSVAAAGRRVHGRFDAGLGGMAEECGVRLVGVVASQIIDEAVRRAQARHRDD